MSWLRKYNFLYSEAFSGKPDRKHWHSLVKNKHILTFVLLPKIKRKKKQSDVVTEFLFSNIKVKPCVSFLYSNSITAGKRDKNERDKKINTFCS